MRLRDALVLGFTAVAVPGCVTAGWLAVDSWFVWRHAGAVAATARFLNDSELGQTALAIEAGQLGAALLLPDPDLGALATLARTTDSRLRAAREHAEAARFDPAPVIGAAAAMEQLRSIVGPVLARPPADRDPLLSRLVLQRRDDQIGALNDMIDEGADLIGTEVPQAIVLLEAVRQVMAVRYALGRRNLVMIGWWRGLPVPIEELIAVERMTAGIRQRWVGAERLIRRSKSEQVRAEAARQEQSFLEGDEARWERLVALAHSRLAGGPQGRLPDWPETLEAFREWSNAAQARILPLRDVALREVSQATRRAAAAARWRLMLATLLMLLSAGISLAVITLLLRRVVLPMQALTDAIRRIGNGERDLAIQGTRRRDEIGGMAVAVAMLRDAAAELDVLLTTDPLSGALNRRAGAAHLDAAFRAWREQRRQFAILLLDVDHFKSINDRWGHEAGDRVLVALVSLCRQTLREADATIRWGGEEFLLLLQGQPWVMPTDMGERLRGEIAAASISHGSGSLRVSVSVGVSEPADGDAEADDVIRRADAALYCAKRNGRNRVEAVC